MKPQRAHTHTHKITLFSSAFTLLPSEVLPGFDRSPGQAAGYFHSKQNSERWVQVETICWSAEIPQLGQ